MRLQGVTREETGWDARMLHKEQASCFDLREGGREGEQRGRLSGSIV